MSEHPKDGILKPPMKLCPECGSEMYYIYRWQCSKCEYEEFKK